jgi:hypothetical protein
MAILVLEYADEKVKQRREEKKRLDDLAAAHASSPRGRLSSQDSLPNVMKGTLAVADSRPSSRQNSFDARSLSRTSSTNSISRPAANRPGSFTKRKKSARTLFETSRANGSGRKMTVPEKPNVEYFGSTKIASVYAKLAQLLILMPFDFYAQISNLDVALENAEKVHYLLHGDYTTTNHLFIHFVHFVF